MSERIPDRLPSVEQQPQIETAEIQRSTESLSEKRETATPSSNVAAASQSTVANARSLQDPKVIEIEGIMASGLDDVYMTLPPEQRQKFRILGEQTAININQLVQSGKANWRKIKDLLMNWLRLIPGVDKYFLEKEAKLKADRLMKLK